MARNSAGQFTSPRYSPNQTGTRKGVSATWQLRGVEQLSARLSGAEPNIGSALEQAHELSAMDMQEEIVQALRERIEQTGRVQRPTQFLINALKSEKTRQVTIRGFTVGGFERLTEAGSDQVKYYARNLEKGTDVHKGQRFGGMFLTGPGGRLVRPREGGKDMRLIRFKNQSPTREIKLKDGSTRIIDVPMIEIKNPIPAYRYFETGTAYFRESHGLVELGYYERTVSKLGVNFLTRWVQRVGTAGPRGSDVTLRSSLGSAQMFD